MRHIRNFVTRLSINYMAFTVLLALAGVSMRERQLFGTWIVATVYTVLHATVRRLLLALFLSFIIMTAGLFIFVIDGALLALTAALTGLTVDSFWSVAASVLLMSITNVWLEKAFGAIGWRTENSPSAEAETAVLTGRSTSWRRRLVMLGILIGGIIFSAAMAAQVFLATGMLTRSVPTITAITGIAFACFALGFAWLAAQGLALERRSLFSAIVAAVTSALIVTPVAVQILSPPPTLPPLPSVLHDDVHYWALSTGSHIAYRRFLALENTDRNPIVFVHGGLGRAVLSTDIEFFSLFAAEGFDVYLYDVVGTGLSGRLDDIRDYTIQRHVRDLEAIRAAIRADQLILIAHAEGSEIAVRYLSAHRDRVERVVFYSPTPMWNDRAYFDHRTRTASRIIPPNPVRSVRYVAALALGLYTPRTAQAYVPQTEMTAWADQLVDESPMVCSGDEKLAPVPQAPGYNPYVGVVGDVTDDLPPDPRGHVRDIFVPTILLRGECDYVDWAVIEQYDRALPNMQAYYVRGAGSMIHLSQPDIVRSIVLAFLNDGPAPAIPLSDREIQRGPP